MFRHKLSLLPISIIIIALSISACKETIVDAGVSEEEVIGTWVLTKIIASYPSGKKESTPAEENLSMTIELNSNNTFQRNQNIKGEITIDSGKWNLTDGILKLVSSSETYNFPCSLNGNVLLAGATVIDPDSGNILPLTLEFTKQEPGKAPN